MTGQQVVVGVDGSLLSARALERAAVEAARRGAALEIVYAVADPDEAGPVLAAALAQVRERHPRLPAVAVPFVGDAARALVQHGRGAVLTVVGHRGLGGVAGRLLGSVSLRVAAHTDGPLLVVRGDRTPGRGEVLLGVEGGAGAGARAYASAEAVRRKAQLRTGPVRTLMAAACGADVIVVAARRRHGRLDPVVQELLHHSHCPVVVVPEGAAKDPPV